VPRDRPNKQRLKSPREDDTIHQRGHPPLFQGSEPVPFRRPCILAGGVVCVCIAD